MTAAPSHAPIALCTPNLAGNELRYVQECIETGWVSSVGAFVTRFEREFAEAVGAAHAIAMVNGTAALHIALISLHGLLLLTVLTVLVELDMARADQAATLARTAFATARNTLIHPVVLPVLAGLLWNATGLGLHPAADEALAGLGQAVVPVCLVLIGLTLAQYGLRGQVSTALRLGALKLLALPALVLATAHWGFGLNGTPLGVVVMMAALPVGSNALIFAQRYGALQAEATAAIVFSTLGFAITATFWLAVLATLA